MVNGKTYFPLLLIAAMTVPMYGLPNILVYMRPQFQNRFTSTKESGCCSRSWQSLWQTLSRALGSFANRQQRPPSSSSCSNKKVANKDDNDDDDQNQGNSHPFNADPHVKVDDLELQDVNRDSQD